MRVRTSRDRPYVVGCIVAADSTTFVVRPRRAKLLLQFGYADVRSVEVRTERSSAGRGALRGAGVGFLTGGVIGAVATGAVYLSDADETCGDCFFPPTAGVAVGAAALTAVTTVLGSVIGAFNPPTRWARVAPARVGVLPAAAARGLILSVAFPF